MLDKASKMHYNDRATLFAPYGSVKVSTGILKQDKRGVLSNHDKGSTLKLNADNTVALAA